MCRQSTHEQNPTDGCVHIFTRSSACSSDHITASLSGSAATISDGAGGNSCRVCPIIPHQSVASTKGITDDQYPKKTVRAKVPTE